MPSMALSRMLSKLAVALALPSDSLFASVVPVPPAEAPSPSCQGGDAVLNWRSEGEPVVGKLPSQPPNEGVPMAVVLWILAAILVISGIFAIFRKQILWGVVLIVVGCLVGPGGVSIFT